MTNWLKIARPSWWMYHWNHRNVLRFWWQYMRTNPFPDNCGGVDDLVHFSKHNKMLGFNHEYIRAYIFSRTHQLLRCTSFVETGTLYGNTSAYARRIFQTPVFTSEISPTYYFVSKANLLLAGGVNRFRLNSPDFLKKVCHESIIGSNPMFFLDAHWYEYIPLAEELNIIRDSCENATIIIDDFFVPQDPRFRYDEYPGFRIDLEVISTTLNARRTDFTTYLPAYNPEEEPYGKATGFAMILMGEKRELPTGTFPFNLLANVSL